MVSKFSIPLISKTILPEKNPHFLISLKSHMQFIAVYWKKLNRFSEVSQWSTTHYKMLRLYFSIMRFYFVMMCNTILLGQSDWNWSSASLKCSYSKHLYKIQIQSNEHLKFGLKKTGEGLTSTTRIYGSYAR